MLKNNLFTSLLSLCEKHEVETRSFKEWEIVLDYESNHSLYIFISWWYSVWAMSSFWWLHEVWEINAPSTLGEGIFFGSFKKPVKVIAESPWEVYILNEKFIAKLARLYPSFHELLMRACLSTTNERIKEANTERSIGYALVDALETNTFGNIPTLLTTLKNTFSLTDVLWIERHEVLSDLFALKYRESLWNIPVNERIKNPISEKSYICIKNFIDIEWYSHIFPLSSREICYGYLVYILPIDHIPGYVRRITDDMIPNCIRLIESGWKK